MKPIFTYFRDIPQDQNNRFLLDFLNTDIVYETHFSSNNDHFLTSKNCNLDLFKDFEAHGDLFDDIKKLSKASRLLLEKGAAYQNDIKEVKLWRGAPGTAFECTSFLFQLSDDVIEHFSWQYKFYDVVENKVRNCNIYAPYDHFFNRG